MTGGICNLTDIADAGGDEVTSGAADAVGDDLTGGTGSLDGV